MKKSIFKNKYVYIGLGAVILLAVLVTGVVFWAGKAKLGRALDASRYTNVRVVAWEQTVSVNDGSTVDPENTDESYVPNLPEPIRIWTQVKDGDNYDCDGPFGRVYCTGQDKTELYFDFEVLNSISPWNLEKTEAGYVCKEGSFDTLCSILGLTNRKNYTNCTLVFQFEGDRLSKIQMTYFYKLESYHVLEYNFEYVEQKVTMPETAQGVGE